MNPENKYDKAARGGWRRCASICAGYSLAALLAGCGGGNGAGGTGDVSANAADDGAPAFEHALFVKAQVMSRRAAPEAHGPATEGSPVSRSDERAVIDAGHKSHAIDSGLPRVWLPEGLVFANGGDEHGVLHGSHLPALGETVWLVPGHCDPTVNLHDLMVGVRGGLASGRVERLLRVDARGRLG